MSARSDPAERVDLGSDSSPSPEALTLALETNERRFRDFAESAGDWFWEVDAELRYHYFEGIREALMGGTVDRLIGMTRREYLQLMILEDGLLERHIEDLESRRPFELEYASQAADGSKRFIRSTGKPFFDDHGQFLGYRGCGRDVTEARLAAEQARLESEARIRDFADTAADWFWEMGTDLRFSYLSESYAARTGLRAEDVLGKTRREIFAQRVKDSPKLDVLLRETDEHKPFRGVEFEIERPDGSTCVFQISGKPVHGTDGAFLGYRGSGIDVTEARMLSRELTYQATHDPLTGLINRREFEYRLHRLLTSDHGTLREHALCYIDLDQFKLVNDTCGHIAGDELLRRLAELLRTKVRKRDTLARLGGDEFGILLEHCSPRQALRVADDVCRGIKEFTFQWEHASFTPGASIGLVPIKSRGGRVIEVLRMADTACYAAKDEGRNRVHVYHEDDTEVARRHGEMQWVVDVNRALDSNRFRLFFQPIVALDPTGADTFNCEVLLRMEDDEGQIIRPEVFLPAAEQYGVISRIDRWVVDATLNWWLEHPRQWTRLHLCTINLSGHSLADESFLRFVMDELQRKNVPAEKLCFEITETAAIANLSSATRFIQVLGERGCSFALDDFGTGLSSFSYLKTLPVQFLKIDGVFVKDILDDPIDYEMVKSINDIGHVMGKRTIAESVDNYAVQERLMSIGVDYVQGYGVAPPRPNR